MPLSSVPLQFLVNVTSSNRSCYERPFLVEPTPAAGSCIAIPVGNNYTARLTGYSDDLK